MDESIEKRAGDLDPQSYFDGVRDAYHPQRHLLKVAGSVLESKAGHHQTFSRSVSNWRWPLWGMALKEVVPASGGGRWRTERVFGEDYYRESAPDYARVQTGVGKSETVLSEGSLVVSYEAGDGERRFLVDVAPGFSSVRVKALADADQADAVEDFFRDLEKWSADNNFYRGQKIDAVGRFLDLESVSEEDLILPEDITRELFRNVKQMVERYDDYAKWNIPAKRGVIMAGPPGNGKTLACKVLAKSLDCTFLWATPKHVEDVGFAGIYEFARELAPAVVLLEDADAFGLDRRLGGFNGVLGELLNVMDGFQKNHGVITILTSNYAEVLDSALTRRPGRFDTKIRIDPPAGPEAFRIITRTLDSRKTFYNGDPRAVQQMATELAKHRASGAYLVEVVNYASMLAVERNQGQDDRLVVTQKDMEDSAGRVLAHLQLDETVEMAVAQEGVFKWGGWPQGSFNGEAQ